ncbi:ATP-binding cassette domain-containing protein [Kribbella jiaozuonensis]|uniref:ABC transporter ATP-binding protein n=1 Tax=Kribbella jiaozuonensis TaxID=2575441 RepID=A0A4U3LZ52_9ACTN|nr:dipeptide/oligopeptide/nickel ABC transporter ATP-binding protein [Kribbella jiaozuonensis]TKK81588.1 ABC transporter ATP-binding protein [Kribbella jiaozuonensis]
MPDELPHTSSDELVPAPSSDELTRASSPRELTRASSPDELADAASRDEHVHASARDQLTHASSPRELASSRDELVRASSAGELVCAESVTKVFRTRAGEVRAVDDVSLTVHRGETLGLVGESGSGKSTVARLMMGLQPCTSGRVVFDGKDLGRLPARELRVLRPRMQMVFQNPYGSLLPHFSAIGNVMEPLRLHDRGDKASRRTRALELLDLVGINTHNAELYPRQFSGGQQQRIAIARALALEPDLLVCDEPTSSLDVSIQAQILELFTDLRNRLGLSMLFISHNLAVVERLADRVAVMNKGRVVEESPTEALFHAPKDNYTRQLLSAVLPVRQQ